MEDPDIALQNFDMGKEHSHEDFDRMLIPLYREDGYPYLDQFEYMDALCHNEEVERLRKEYFRHKKNKK